MESDADPLHHCAMPFTSLRVSMDHLASADGKWYRLALHAAVVAPHLSSQSDLLHSDYICQCLQICLESAVQIILSVSDSIGSAVMDLTYDRLYTLPVELSIDTLAIRRLVYSVDSTWISLCFAVIFLVICQARGAISGKRRPVLNAKISRFADAQCVII